MSRAILSLGNVYCRVSHPPDAIDSLRRAFRFQPEGYRYMQAYKVGAWDGWSYAVARNGAFLTGLLPRVLAHLNQKMKLQVQFVKDARNRLEHKPYHVHGIDLRPYQHDAIQAALRCERGVLNLATGGGKTELSAGIISAYDVKTAFLTHLSSLRYQSAERLAERLRRPIGLIGGDDFSPQQITVCMVPTLASRLKAEDPQIKAFCAGVEVLVFDECHHSKAKTWMDTSRAFVRAYHRFGLSATPFASVGEELNLTGHAGDVVYRLDPKELQAQGHLVPATVTMYTTHGVPGAFSYFSSYADQYRSGIVDNEPRNRQIAKLAVENTRDANERVLILVVQQQHGMNIEQACNSLIPNSAQFVYGLSSYDERKSAETAFRSGSKILIASRIFGEGKDLPCITTLINAGGGKSDKETIQKVGRGLRLAPGKSHLRIIDFKDSLQYLARHSRQRMRTYSALGFEIVGA